jgi:hypothetical protein
MSFWDSFTKSASDAAETTKLVTLRSAKQVCDIRASVSASNERSTASSSSPRQLADIQTHTLTICTTHARARTQAEIMYIESQITSTLNAFGNDAYPAMEANDSERVRAFFVAAKRVVDQYRADIAAKNQDIDELNERIARVGLDDDVPAVRLERPGDVRSQSRHASGSSLNDL